MNILFTSLGTGGDVLPLLHIGKRLKARGHNVTLLSHCYYRNVALQDGLDFAELDTPEEYAGLLKMDRF